MEIIKDWWGVIVAFLVGAAWVGKIQAHVWALQRETFVTNDHCGERRREIRERNDLQFATGHEQFKEIKLMVSELQRSHNELIKTILEDRKK